MIHRLFRAKEYKNESWVYGSLLVGEDSVFICWETATKGVFQTVKVEPHTVGQYSGYRDICTTMLFEGDIITSGHRFEYTIVFAGTSFKAQAKSGLLFDLEDIFSPLKERSLHDGK